MPTLFGASPRMRFDLVINLLTAKAVSEGKITVFGGNQWRPFLHTEDAAEAYITCLEAPLGKVSGQIFNVGSDGNNYKIIQVAEMIRKTIPKAEIIVDESNADRRNYRISFEKFHSAFGFKAEKSVSDGISEISKMGRSILDDYKNKRYCNVS